MSNVCDLLTVFTFILIIKLYLHFATTLNSSILLFQTLPWSCASGSPALHAGGGQSCREEDSVWVLVLLYPWLTYRGSAPFNSPHNYTEGLFPKGLTQHKYFLQFSSVCLITLHNILVTYYFCLLFPGTIVCTSGVVSNTRWLPSVSGCGRRHGIPPNFLHPVLLHTGHRHQRAAPSAQSGSAGRDLPSNTHAGHKGGVKPVTVSFFFQLQEQLKA